MWRLQFPEREMKYTIYARPPGFFSWLVVGWYIVKILQSREDALAFIDNADLEGYYMVAVEMPLPLPIKFRLWPKLCRTLKMRYT